MLSVSMAEKVPDEYGAFTATQLGQLPFLDPQPVEVPEDFKVIEQGEATKGKIKALKAEQSKAAQKAQAQADEEEAQAAEDQAKDAEAKAQAARTKAEWAKAKVAHHKNKVLEPIAEAVVETATDDDK